MWISAPLTINKTDLNKAWVIRWKKANFFKSIESVNIINPICLKVENATISLQSNLHNANTPPTTIVEKDKIHRTDLEGTKLIKLWWRKIKYKPAVTNVDECTKDETGVGAAMALGSQNENGSWALLVNAVRMRKKESIKQLSWPKKNKFQVNQSTLSPKITIMQQSPNRLVYIVIKLEFNLFLLW